MTFTYEIEIPDNDVETMSDSILEQSEGRVNFGMFIDHILHEMITTKLSENATITFVKVVR